MQDVAGAGAVPTCFEGICLGFLSRGCSTVQGFYLPFSLDTLYCFIAFLLSVPFSVFFCFSCFLPVSASLLLCLFALLLFFASHLLLFCSFLYLGFSVRVCPCLSFLPFCFCSCLSAFLPCSCFFASVS